MARINTEDLPLKYKYNIPAVDINPFTYKSLLDYLRDMPSKSEDLYMYDMTWLLKDDLNCRHLLIPDAEYLIFLKKAISIDGDLSFKTEVKCPRCEFQNIFSIDGTELKFTRPVDEVLYGGIWMELTTGTYLCKIPTLDKLLKVIELTSTYGTTKHLDLIKSIAMINEQELNPMQVERSILYAGSEDIATIIEVYDMLYRSLLPIDRNCRNNECELHNSRGMSIEVSSLIGNVFRSILLSKPVKRDKIYIKQVGQKSDTE